MNVTLIAEFGVVDGSGKAAVTKSGVRVHE